MSAAEADAEAGRRLAAGDEPGAIAVLRAGQMHQPHPVLATNLGRLVWRTGAVDEALELLEWATATAPDQAAGWVNLGDARAAADDPRAEHAYRRAIGLVANPAEIHWSIAVDLLTRGQWRRAWPHYACRARHPRVRRRPSPYPPLAARRRPGGRILLWSHEGVGEDLRHVALLPRLLAQGFEVVLEVDPRLVPLFARSFPTVIVVPRTWPPQPAAADRAIVAHSALGDLPAWLGLEPADLPPAAPWLKADMAAVARLRSRYAALGPGPIVGLSWQSSGTPFAAAKSLGLARLAPLLAVEGVTFVDLQYGADEIGRATLEPALARRLHRDAAIDPATDLDGFAAQVAALDLVVSSSNTTVHMAGALGIPAWTMLHRGPPITPYWIGGIDGSPWYPRMKVWRQNTPGDWATPLSAIMNHFKSWLLSLPGRSHI